MESIVSIKPFIAVLVSIAAVPFLILSRRANIRESWTFIAALAKFLIVLSMLPAILKGNQLVFTLAEVVPGVAIRFRVDALGM
ncbi:MAG: multicomponent Na+:H+ antiporter subunit, partial [Thermodesulfobacteriota bacterium]|nr:multicomponent Na+:H+ antiporter subunit [Thermodesulfobacteriota bacterium]